MDGSYHRSYHVITSLLPVSRTEFTSLFICRRCKMFYQHLMLFCVVGFVIYFNVWANDNINLSPNLDWPDKGEMMMGDTKWKKLRNPWQRKPE